METGIFIRAEVNGEWGSYDIGDKTINDKQVLDWLRSRGGKNEWAEQVVLTLLDRNQFSVRMVNDG
jgi:hypothetical protein